MKPPIDTTIPSMKDRHVKYLTGLSSIMPLSFSAIESERAGVDDCEFSCCCTEGCSLDRNLGKPMMSCDPAMDLGLDKEQWEKGEIKKGIKRIERKKKRRQKDTTGSGSTAPLYVPASTQQSRMPTKLSLYQTSEPGNRKSPLRHRVFSGGETVDRNARGGTQRNHLAPYIPNVRRLSRTGHALEHRPGTESESGIMIDGQVKGNREMPLGSRVGSLVGMGACLVFSFISAVWRNRAEGGITRGKTIG